jgi:hypothetical protein
MTAATIWIGLTVLVLAALVGGVVWWGRTTGPATDNDTIPSQPPAGPGAEGMRVPEPGDITTGSPEDAG